MKRKNPAAVALGRRGGKVTSEAKAEAVRRNGRLGGGTPKYQIGDMVTIRAGAPVMLVGCLGTVTAYLGPTLYRVSISGLDYEVRSWWLRGFRRALPTTTSDPGRHRKAV